MMCAQKTTSIASAHDGTSKRAGFDVADWVALFSHSHLSQLWLYSRLLLAAARWICTASPLTGMVTMYSLMSVVHSAHWLKLLYGR